MKRRLSPRCVNLLGIASLAMSSAFTPGCEAFDTERPTEKRGSVGEEIYGVLCDRLGAQALREDLSGGSFKAVCHRTSASGEFADAVDETLLPPFDESATDSSGNLVSIEKQRADRAKAVGRVGALARRRTDLIRALDVSLPATKIPVKDIENADPTQSCGTPAKEEAVLTDAVSDMLGRMTDLYNDGTIPQSTRSLGRVVSEFTKSEDAQKAWARISARQGYRPVDTALGTARPVLAYPHIRDFANATLRLLSADSTPYDPHPQLDADGNRIPVAGPGNAAFNKLLETSHEELLAAKADARLPTLVTAPDPSTTRVILSRPRDNVEVLQEILLAQDDAFVIGKPRFIVRRDDRGYARIRGGQLPSPFIDQDRDGLPDVDLTGQFLTTNKSVAPSPFPFPGSTAGSEGAARDAFQRAQAGDGLLYDYLDTSRTFAAQVLKDVKALTNPDPAAKHETLMDLVGGLPIAMGPRETRTKDYGTTKLAYDGIDTDQSPVLDLVYAMSTILGDRSADTTLALTRELFSTQTSSLARVVGAINHAYDIAQKHPEAVVPRKSTFWDEKLDTFGKLVKEPGLLEDVMRALAAPETQELGNTFARFAAYKDEVSYDPNDINGPTFDVTTGQPGNMSTLVDRGAPITGTNRSALHRFLQLVNDTVGVTACNKPGAKVHALGLSLPVSFDECAVFKIENLGAFYLDAIANAQQYDPNVEIPRGTIYMRPSLLRIAPGLTTVLESSSGITGFWPAAGNIAAPTPNFLNRLVFFDLQNDTGNDTTKTFIADLQGDHIGTSVCPERVIQDPSPDAKDARPDGMVVGLRNCPEGQWLQQRNKNTIFTTEQFGFYDAIRPLLGAFVKHHREDLFLDMSTELFRHYAGPEATPDECALAGNTQCTREGLVSYEGLVTEAFATDLIPALGELSKALDTMAIKRCDAIDTATQACTTSTLISGIDAVAAAARATLDPEYATQVRLTDRHGAATAKRNDGTVVPQVTPAHLLTNALSAIDLAFDKYEEQNPADTDRRAGWRRARSQLVDQFLGTTAPAGSSVAAAFANPALPKMAPMVVDMLRSQLVAHCPTSFWPPYETCAWARTELTHKAEETLGGPLMTTGIDVVDAIRKDPDGRRETEILLQYLLDAGSGNDALASLLASASDAIQLLRDDENLIPLFKVLASAMNATTYDDKGRIVEKSLVDAQMALLARLSGKFIDPNGTEICSREIDPNQVLAAVLAKVVTPIDDGDFKGQSPLEVIIDVIADVNRADPTTPYSGTLGKDDYRAVGENVVDFLTNKERGLEQFYEVIRQGTKL
jgi:hypothetical protein